MASSSDKGEAGAMLATDRALLCIGGADRVRFLNDLVTNALSGLDDGLVYAALLTPQGKYLADFFLLDAARCAGPGDAILIDADGAQAPALAQRLSMYKLRADVTVAPSDLAVLQGWGLPAPPGALPDPRHPTLGWRLYTDNAPGALEGLPAGTAEAWQRRRIAAGVPAAGIELIPNESYILEAGFDRLNGVDFQKGCYVGQEVTARMRHKTTLRKGLVPVRVEGQAPPGTPVEREGRPVGTLYSNAGGCGLAHLRFDRAEGPMTAGAATVIWDQDPATAQT